MPRHERHSSRRSLIFHCTGRLLIVIGLLGGCARLPYTTQVLYEDRRVVVALQREPKPAGYSHPAKLHPEELSAILNSFSFRARQSLPLRWYAEEVPPKQIFRADELFVLVPHLADALQMAGPDERVHFQLLAPGMNPASDRDTTAGWIAVRDPYFYLYLEHYHAQFPIRKSEEWDLRYPALPPQPGSFILYFEPGRFWVTDPVSGQSAVQLREFLKSAIVPSKK